jgi:phosphonate transport system substrate-binding protein
MTAQYGPLAAWLQETTGVPVSLVVATSYADLIDRLMGHSVDLAILPPATFALARRRSADIRLLASQIAGGATSYSSYLVVSRNAPINALSELRGRRVALVDAHSASGFVLPWAAFLEHGLDPTRDFASVHFAGSHSKAIADVLEGRADVAATYSGMLDYTRRTGRTAAEVADLRIIHKAGRVPYDALCAAPGLSQALDARLAGAFLSLDTRSARGRRVYGQTNNHVSGWAPASEVHYDTIRRTMDRVAAHRAQLAGGRDVRP